MVTPVASWTGVFTGPEGAFVSVGEHDGGGVRYRGAGRGAVVAHRRTVLGVL